MNSLKVFMRGWLYNLRRSTRNNIRIQQAKMSSLVRQRVPGFNRRRKV